MTEITENKYPFRGLSTFGNTAQRKGAIIFELSYLYSPTNNNTEPLCPGPPPTSISSPSPQTQVQFRLVTLYDIVNHRQSCKSEKQEHTHT